MYEIDCLELTNYVTHRQQVLTQVMDYYKVNRDQAKRLFIIILYGGMIDTWKRGNNNTKTALPFF